MVPLPAILFYAVTFPLQSLAAQQAAWALDLLGVPVILDGNVIHLSQLSLGVTEAYSGIRSLVSLLGGAVAWAYLALPGGWMMLIFVASTVPITILANAGRVISTGLIRQWFGVEYASGYFQGAYQQRPLPPCIGSAPADPPVPRLTCASSRIGARGSSRRGAPVGPW